MTPTCPPHRRRSREANASSSPTDGAITYRDTGEACGWPGGRSRRFRAILWDLIPATEPVLWGGLAPGGPGRPPGGDEASPGSESVPPKPRLNPIGRLREALAASQEGLDSIARRAEVSRRSLARFVAGDRGLTFEVAAAVVKALGLQSIPTRPPRRNWTP